MSSISKLLPSTVRSGGNLRETARIIKNLLSTYGWYKTKKNWECLNSSGEPIPWFTYSAIDYISQLDLSDKEVFEYGSGYSTLFWSGKTKRVVAVEDNKEWFDQVSKKIGPNVELILSPSETFEYVNQIEKYGDFDIIIIDGTGDSRLPCTEMAKKHIRKGGMIILDNSDLWVDSAANLRKDDRFIQVDFTSFAPIVSNACTTSIFFTRDFRVNPLGNRQPHKSVAQPAEQWREDRSVLEKMKK